MLSSFEISMVLPLWFETQGKQGSIYHSNAVWQFASEVNPVCNQFFHCCLANANTFQVDCELLEQYIVYKLLKCHAPWRTHL